MANRFWSWAGKATIDPLTGLFRMLSDLYRERKYLRDTEPSAVFWFNEAGQCQDHRWSVSAVPWKGSKEKVGWQSLTWLPEMGGRALHAAIVKTLKEREPRETVLFLDTIGIMFENHFWFAPIKDHEVLAIMRQRLFRMESGPSCVVLKA